MTGFGILTVIVTLLYFFLLLLLAVSWANNPVFNSSDSKKTSVSIIIPFRNEKDCIADCLESITKQRYPHELIEIIAVDDHSEDESASIVKQFPGVRFLACDEKEKGKKSALKKGIAASSHELIITRDADTISNEDWLSIIVSCYEKTGARMIICPVILHPENSMLNIIQRLEHFALSSITAATAFLKIPVMCNGANLCFTRTVFEQVNGYEENLPIASGDDIFLLNKIKAEEKNAVHFLKNIRAAVYTSTAPTLKTSLQQRIRWAGKNRFNPSITSRILSLHVVFCNVLFLFSGVLSVFSAELTPYFIFTAILKCFIDFLLLFLASSFQKQRSALIAFPVMVIVYPVYTLWILFAAGTGKTIWKGREIK